MSQIPQIFDHQLLFDPAADLEVLLKNAPAKWAVYLLADETDQPVQLLCVKNLRYSLKRRLSADPHAAPSKRVDYRQIVRRVYWRRVDSALEADWHYLEAARHLFPSTYRGMVAFRSAWFVHVNPDAEFPRYIKTMDLAKHGGIYLGPLEDKHAAARLIDLVQDGFDLCRYYNILVQAPHGRACAYKEMGKCPAPCDGSISMPQYHRLIELSAAVLADPQPCIREQTRRMQQAAADLRFETAAKIKAYIDQLSQLGKGPFRHLRRLQDFAYVALQYGPRAGAAKVLLIQLGRIEEVAGLIAEPAHPAELMRLILLAAESHPGPPLDAAAVERIGVVSHHLFSARATQGVFIPLMDISEQALARAYRDLLKQKMPEATEGEGVVNELQAM